MDQSEAARPTPVEIPLDAISDDALEGVLESFVMREGTDYGAQEIGHEAKLQRVRRQLVTGDIKIVFDPESESVTLMTKHEWTKFQASQD